ncbi:UNVERIFIED_CONTAM: Glucosamine inositolphosphorylceramide transferase 1 [Sesamum radiatum]|uniref:Glucosamine inositolphosphorylceramide transferase 1 n=1 Tax=Sesamum radiatum TaxID=300843 RepID=A0AAW2KAC3_SESRA
MGARNGGRPFVYNGNLYRIGQDSGETYGRRTRIFKVEVLTTDEFKEVEVPLDIKKSVKGRNAWNGARHHHIDIQQLSSGEWIAVLDGDRIPSGDAVHRFILGFASVVAVAALVILGGILLGPVNDANMYGVKNIYGGSGAQEPYPLNGHYSQFTLLTMTYDARLWNLNMYVKHYSRCSSVREIVVVWNKGVPPQPSDFDSAVPIRIRVEKQNSLNNRFNMDPLIKTRAVLELDDDIMMTCDDVERGFKVWREHPTGSSGFILGSSTAAR